MDQSSRNVQGKILIVEDDSEFVGVIQRFLKLFSAQLSVESVASGEEAFVLLKDHSYDFVIVDYTLAGRANGLYVWEYCRKKYPTIPLLMISGLSVEQFLSMMVGHKDFPRFLPKPFMRGDLQRVMNDVFPSQEGASVQVQNKPIRRAS